mgnify:CR=1 FL=1
MAASGEKKTGTESPDSEVANEVWQLMSDLVLDNQRRRQVTEATGMTFGRSRLIRRVAAKPMTMGELASVLGIERPNASALVNELEDQGLVLRKADPNDRRTRLVVATRKGKAVADRANRILKYPPGQLADLDGGELEQLRKILRKTRQSD